MPRLATVVALALVAFLLALGLRSCDRVIPIGQRLGPRFLGMRFDRTSRRRC